MALFADVSGFFSAPLSEAELTVPRLRECLDCGLFQVVPSLGPGSVARCSRCNGVLRRTHHDALARALALNVAALPMLAIGCGMSLMTVSTGGIQLTANMLSGPEGLHEHGIWELAVVLLFTTIAAPFLKMTSMIYVLVGLRMQRPPRHLRQVFSWIEHLRPWAMIEVFLIGVFVAYVKLSGMVHIEIGVALYALFALMLTTVAADAMLDRQAVWEEMERLGIPDADFDHAVVAAVGPSASPLACETCGLVNMRHTQIGLRCVRCGAHLHARKPNSIPRTWALLIAAAILYVPANVYPVLTVMQLGSGAPSTILGGVEELLTSGMYPLAGVVFFASILVPMLKLVGLTILLVTTMAGWRKRLRDRTVLYRIVRAVGRWSMIDVFMESILVALVQFGALVTIDPGFGAVAFAGVVILTMFAAEGFDPRLMWDAASRSGESAASVT